MKEPSDIASKKHSTLFVFVHIPKTAGSTINHYLQQSILNGQDHIEQWLEKNALARERIEGLDWVSGHVSFPAMRAFLSQASPRHMRYFSTFRDPIEQITSHYNWLIEIFHKGESFYNSHPEVIKKISEKIRHSNNEDISQIIANIKTFPGLFLNQQSRVLLGEDCPKLSTQQVLDRLKVYEFVATERHIPALIEKMTGTLVAEPSQENKSGYHFDPAVFRTPEMQDFLGRHHKSDIHLYDLLIRQGGCFPAAGPQPT